MEFLDTLLGAGIAVAGYLVGTRAKSRNPKTKASICGCLHHRSFHSDGTGSCHQKIWDMQCPCQQYRGPKTLDDLIPED